MPRHNKTPGLQEVHELQLGRDDHAIWRSLPGHHGVLLPDGVGPGPLQTWSLPWAAPRLFPEEVRHANRGSADGVRSVLRALPHNTHPVLHLPTAGR